jgi:hypothetical protein
MRQDWWQGESSDQQPNGGEQPRLMIVFHACEQPELRGPQTASALLLLVTTAEPFHHPI